MGRAVWVEVVVLFVWCANSEDSRGFYLGRVHEVSEAVRVCTSSSLEILVKQVSLVKAHDCNERTVNVLTAGFVLEGRLTATGPCKE